MKYLLKIIALSLLLSMNAYADKEYLIDNPVIIKGANLIIKPGVKITFGQNGAILRLIRSRGLNDARIRGIKSSREECQTHKTLRICTHHIGRYRAVVFAQCANLAF